MNKCKEQERSRLREKKQVNKKQINKERGIGRNLIKGIKLEKGRN
jgi:hypothetical protein